MLDSSTMEINPNIPDAYVLRGWYDSVGAEQRFTATSSGGPRSGGAVTFNRAEIRTIQDIQANTEGVELFSCRGTILQIGEENLTYPACPDQSCRKKVNETEEGWYCEKCKQTWEKPEYR